jgi:N-acetylglutamate synthase-like GNAT family acetyltransferase
MNARNEIQVPATRAAQLADLPAIVGLLNEAGLPTGDLADGLPGRFLVVEDGPGTLIGVIGLESNGRTGLLRSLAVAPAWRGQAIAARLVERCEMDARAAGVDELYLLTTSAADYFLRRAYALVERGAVPAAIAQHAQFRSLCPASACCLRKTLG